MASALRVSFLILATCPLFICGCSFEPVNIKSFSDDPCIRIINPNNGPFIIENSQEPDPNNGHTQTVRIIKWKPVQIGPAMKDNLVFSAKYNNWDFHLFSKAVIPVKMPGDRTYSAILDTGCPIQVYINDAVVRDCNIAVFPGGRNPNTGSFCGLCEIPSMVFANIRVKNPVCWYDQRQWQFKVLGIPFYRRRIILIGLDLMSSFSYVHFNNVKQRVEFNLNESFKPEDFSQWVHLPFVLENIRDEHRMMIDISMSNNIVHVEFDTGGSKPGLTLTDAAWQRLKDNVKARFVSDRKHQSYQYGYLPCSRCILPEVNIGQMKLKNIKADILLDGSLLLKGLEGQISLHCFKKTSVVLDFKRKLIWIKKF
jgi:hypothetical protein